MVWLSAHIWWLTLAILVVYAPIQLAMHELAHVRAARHIGLPVKQVHLIPSYIDLDNDGDTELVFAFVRFGAVPPGFNDRDRLHLAINPLVSNTMTLFACYLMHLVVGDGSVIGSVLLAISIANYIDGVFNLTALWRENNGQDVWKVVEHSSLSPVKAKVYAGLWALTWATVMVLPW